MVCHHMPFHYFYTFVLAQQPDDILQIRPVLFIYRLPPVLRDEHDMVLTHPFGMC